MNSIFSYKHNEETGEKGYKENCMHAIIMYTCLWYII